jgi:hypothetical protein
MGNFKLRWRSFARVLLVSAAAFFSGGAALAQVNGFVVINPISVCVGGLCAPFGVSCTSASGTQVCTQFATPSTATVTTPIGSVDADTSVNLTRAFWAQAGIDVAFFPVQEYNVTSTSNANPWSSFTIKDAINTTNTFSYSATSYQTLHQVNLACQDGTIVTASPDFMALTQHQVCTEHGGIAGSLSKLPNPPGAPSPAPPLGSTLGESNALDVFFINTIVAPPGSSSVGLYGFSWINGDGVSIEKLPFLPTAPRFDTLAHEIGHALGLDHTTYGAGNTVVNNLMTSGSYRGTSAKSGCQVYTTSTGTPPVYNGGALYDLDYNTLSFMPCGGAGNMAADQLTPGSDCPSPLNMTTCSTQEGAAAISPFINLTLASTAAAGGGMQASVAGSATNSNSTVAAQTANSSSGVPFEVDGVFGTGETGDSINSVIIALPDISGITFSGSSPATQTGGVGGVNIINQVRLNGNSGSGNSNCVKSINLAPPSVQCLQIFFSTGGPNGGGNAFVAGDSVTFNLALNKDPTTIINGNLLDGTQYTVITAAGYATTSLFGAAVNGVFSADSRNPDLTTPNQISTNFVSAKVVSLGPILSKCTPPYIVVGNGKKAQTLCPGGTLPEGE